MTIGNAGNGATEVGEERAGSGAMRYVPALDGLRAIAVLGVLIFHTLPGALRGGFTGVDVFFVLSGYLITSVILHGIRGGTFSMKEFYLRRIQRLLPNAVITILFTVALAQVALLPSQAVKVATHGLWAVFNLSNIYIWRHVGGYWGDAAASVPLLHTWSLGVEEQFYLLFPALLLFLARRTHLVFLLACLSLASLALCIFATPVYPAATFYLLPTRAWELLLGATLGACVVPLKIGLPSRRLGSSLLLEVAGWAGLAAILAGFVFITETGRFPGAIALVPAIGSLAVVICAADGRTGPARLLSRPILVKIGKLSYSLYLWHWPLIVIGRQYADITGQSNLVWTLIGAGTGIALSVLAYYTIEQPLRQRSPGRRRRLRIVAAGFSACAVACLAIALRHPVADPMGRFDRPAFYGGLYTLSPWNPELLRSSTRYADVLIPPEQKLPPHAWTDGGIIHNWGKGNPRIVVFGSSHAIMYGRLLDDISRQAGISIAFFAFDGLPVFFPTPSEPYFSSPAQAESFDAARRKWVKAWHPDAVLVMDRWDLYAGKPEEFNRKLSDLAGELAPYTRHVIFFSQPPVLRLGEKVNLREYVTWYFRRFGALPRIAPDDHEALRRSALTELEAVARDFPHTEVLRVDAPFYEKDGSVRYSYGRQFFYADDDHLSDSGAEVVRDICARAIMGATAADPPIRSLHISLRPSEKGAELSGFRRP